MARKAGVTKRKPAPATPGTDGTVDSKSARTRTRILDAAARVLSLKGYAGLRLAEVAEYAELQAPTIYYYFPSREDLIEEVMWVGLAGMREHLTHVLTDAPADLGPLERIMLAVETHLRHELEVSDYTTAVIRNAGQVPEKIRKRQRTESTAYGEIWRQLIAAAHDEGLIRPGLDLTIAQMLVMGALNWTAEWYSPRRDSVDSVVAVARSFVRNGIAGSSDAGVTRAD